MLGNTMSTIQHVLHEEYERLKELVVVYLKKLEAFPRGRPRVKVVRGSEYVYLNRREGHKVVDEYIGRVDSEKVQELYAQISRRDQVIRLLAEARQQLKDVERALRGKV